MIKKIIYHPLKNFVARIYIRFLKFWTPLKVIGITGSAGKTTTKEMVASILKQAGLTVWSRDNIDPIYNIPSTILRTPIGTKYLVLEMGVEKPGEMDFYLSFVKPDAAIITNIFPAHTEFFGDVDGVFREKSKLALSLSQNGIAVLNKNDRRLVKLGKKLKSKVFWFSGENQDAASVLAKSLGIKSTFIKKGLASYTHPPHRATIIKHKSGAVIYDDSYNSNPEAFLWTLQKFNALAGKHQKVAVVGDMLELGRLAVSEHKRVGLALKKSRFSQIWGVGKLVRHLTPYVFTSWKKVLPHLKPYLKPGVYILIKGSRSIGLDWLVLELTS